MGDSSGIRVSILTKHQCTLMSAHISAPSAPFSLSTDLLQHQWDMWVLLLDRGHIQPQPLQCVGQLVSLGSVLQKPGTLKMWFCL